MLRSRASAMREFGVKASFTHYSNSPSSYHQFLIDLVIFSSIKKKKKKRKKNMFHPPSIVIKPWVVANEYDPWNRVSLYELSSYAFWRYKKKKESVRYKKHPLAITMFPIVLIVISLRHNRYGITMRVCVFWIILRL